MKPIPAEDGLEDVILYDGVCVFCSRWVRWVIERDPAGRFRFAPVQGDIGAQLARRFGLDPDAPKSNALARGGRVLFKSDASLAVLSSLPGWKWTRVFAIVPRPLRDWVYDQIAGNRYRWFGRTDQCWLPDPDNRRRLMD